jgi:hypothetical protein
MTPAIYDFFIGAIKGNRAVMVERVSCRVGIFSVNFQGQAVKVVYDAKREQLVTALTPKPKPVPVVTRAPSAKEFAQAYRAGPFGVVRTPKEEEHRAVKNPVPSYS